MRKKKILLALATLGLLWPTTGYACECAKENILEKYKKATVVFVGKVIATKKYDVIKIYNGHQQTTFQITEILKGKEKRQLTLHSCFGFDCCLDEFKMGETVLVFASKKGKKYGTGFCNGTTRAIQPETLAQLREVRIKG